MAEYIELEKVLDDKNIITVQTREYGSIEVIPVDTIADIESVDFEPKDRWISVDDRLPVDNNRVLCYIRATTGGGGLYMLGSYQIDVWVFKTTRNHCAYLNPQMRVLYWQPLPEPPKEG